MITIRYTQWDGTQRVRLNAEKVFEKLSEYLSYTDDVQQALDWLMRQGAEFEGMRVMGLDEFLEEVRDQLRQRYRQFNLKNALDEMRQRLEDLLDLEKDTLDEHQASTPALKEKRDFLERLPHRISEALERLKQYDFEDGQARQEFENLLDELDNIGSLEDFQRRYGKL